LQKDPTQQTKGKMLFGEYRIVKLSKKTLKSTPIMNSDGHTIDGYKHPVFCGDLKEAITLFDRNVLTIDLNDKGAGLWDVTLWDLGEVDENFSDDDAEGVTLSLQVTIFSESDEVELAREIKKLMKEKGFSFEGRNGDDSKPEDGIYMKAQRFSKFYEMEE